MTADTGTLSDPLRGVDFEQALADAEVPLQALDPKTMVWASLREVVDQLPRLFGAPVFDGHGQQVAAIRTLPAGEPAVAELIAAMRMTAPSFEDQSIEDFAAGKARRLADAEYDIAAMLLDRPNMASDDTARLRSVRRAAARVSSRLELRRLRQLERRLDVAVAGAQESAGEAEEARQAAAAAAGVTGELTMSHHFADLARRDGRLAAVWQILVVLSLIALVLYSTWVAATAEGVEEIARRIAGALPGLLLTGFFTREANARRRSSTWARVLVVQSNSLDAYVRNLPQAETDRLRSDFGRRLFLAGPTDESAAESPDTDAVTDAVIPELMRRFRGA